MLLRSGKTYLFKKNSKNEKKKKFVCERVIIKQQMKPIENVSFYECPLNLIQKAKEETTKELQTQSQSQTHSHSHSQTQSHTQLLSEKQKEKTDDELFQEYKKEMEKRLHDIEHQRAGVFKVKLVRLLFQYLRKDVFLFFIKRANTFPSIKGQRYKQLVETIIRKIPDICLQIFNLDNFTRDLDHYKETLNELMNFQIFANKHIVPQYTLEARETI